MPISTILVVEDHKTVRQFICSELQQAANLRLIGEASDGLEAVQKALELQPDVILLDIGLPKLNGIEAAREIRNLAPFAKLLFVSLESSPDVVRETFRWGGLGYVYKPRLWNDLLPAVEAVLGGKEFVSCDVNFNQCKDAGGRHEVHFYSDDAVFVEGGTRFIAAALQAGNPAIVLATQSHRQGLAQKLREIAIDIDTAVEEGIYISRDAAESNSQIMVNGSPDLGRFWDGLSILIESASKAAKTETPRVAIFGECAGIMCTSGKREAAIQLEKTGNDIVRTNNVDIVCAYPLNAFHRREDDPLFTSICDAHTAVHFR